MPRLDLKSREPYPFSCEIVVRTTDLNYGGHLGNDRLLSLVQEARVAFLASHGWSELDCGGTGLIMADAALSYRAEAFAGDVLRFEVAAVEPSRVGFRLAMRVTRPDDGKLSDDTLVALVETGMVCFDYARRRPVALPVAVRAACRQED